MVQTHICAQRRSKRVNKLSWTATSIIWIAQHSSWCGSNTNGARNISMIRLLPSSRCEKQTTLVSGLKYKNAKRIPFHLVTSKKLLVAIASNLMAMAFNLVASCYQ